MSRIGKKIIPLPKGVSVQNNGAGEINVKGGKGQLTFNIDATLQLETEDNQVRLVRPNEERRTKAQHGLARTLVANAVHGVSEGFTKSLQIIGVGYRAQAAGQGLQLQLGYSHPIDISPIDGITFDVDVDPKAKTNFIHVRGIDKQKVGQVAANLRSLRPPEPYKGKGIKYTNEVILRKMGKAGKAGK
jgi:large subunit ribosomal protein L6